MSNFCKRLMCLAIVSLMSSVAANDQDDRIVIGDTFTVHSEILDESRRINVFTPTVYGEPVEAPLPVLYMPDGGMHEDFLHVAGLLQVLVSNGTMRPFMLVGIENTERRRDMTGPSDDPEDQAIAPRIGGASKFRAFIKEELFAAIERRYTVTQERAIIGESLAGLFVIDTLLHAPEMFETYVAVDPSVWWNRYALNNSAAELLKNIDTGKRRLFVAASNEASSSERFKEFVSVMDEHPARVALTYAPMPEETHATLYHPAALKALPALFAVEAGH